MDVDALAREKRERYENMTDFERITQEMYEGREPSYSETECSAYTKALADDIANKQEELNYLGKGKGKGKGKSYPKGGGKGWGASADKAGKGGGDAKGVICVMV